MGVTNFEVHPDWDGDFIRGNDLAVLTLDGEPTNQIADYALFTGSNETDAASVQKVGFGRSGTGALGDTVGAGTKRAGLNTYDAVADTMLTAFGLTPVTDFVPGSVLKFDFDNGLVGQDAFDFFFNIDDLGLSLDEVMSAPGDSGGPTFIEVGNELLVAGVGRRCNVIRHLAHVLERSGATHIGQRRHAQQLVRRVRRRCTRFGLPGLHHLGVDRERPDPSSGIERAVPHRPRRAGARPPAPAHLLVD